VSAWLEKLRAKKKGVAIGIALSLVVGGGGVFFLKKKPSSAHGEGAEPAHAEHDQPAHAEHDKPAHAEHDKPAHAPSSGFLARVSEAFQSLQATVREIRRLDLENQRLKLENTQLRLRAEAATSALHEARAREWTSEKGEQLARKLGSQAARSVASISYVIPTHLMPQQLYALAVGYFKSGESEKAAKIFTFLSGIADAPEFQSSGHALMTGVAWYRLKNWELAETFFSRAIERVAEDDARASELKNAAQARLWKALVAQRRGHHQVAQSRLGELLEYHPRSPEARWINPHQDDGGARARVPAQTH
jgi:tetratricopeptide (TPR) repeat protein